MFTHQNLDTLKASMLVYVLAMPIKLEPFKHFFSVCFKGLFGIWALHWLVIALIGIPVLTRLFDMNAEKNIPTLFSCLLIGGAMMSLFAISSFYKGQKNKMGLYWKGLAWVFALLCLDEWFSIHDTLGGQIAKLFIQDVSHPWLYTYAVLCVIGGLLCIPFFKDLPKKTAFYFIFAGGIYILGAMGFECLNSFFQTPHILNGIYFIEEALEMVGMLLFWWALLDFIKHHTTLTHIPLYKKTYIFFGIIALLDLIASQIAFAS